MRAKHLALSFVLIVSSLVALSFAQSNSYTYSYNPEQLALEIIFIITVVATLYFIIRYAYLSIRLIVIGIALILLGTDAWYLGAILQNVNIVYAGIYAILIGVVVWALGDWKGGAFNERIAALLHINKIRAEEVVRTGTEKRSEYIRRRMKK